MSAEPIGPGDEEAGTFEVIHFGGESAVVVPMADFLRRRALEKSATREALEDAEDWAAVAEIQARDAAGLTEYVSGAEAKRRLGLEG